MDPESKQLIKESIEISKSNNELLSKLVKAQKRATTYRLIYWGVLIFFSFGAYYFIQPFLGTLFNVYTGGVSGTTNIGDVLKNLGDKQQMQNLLNTVQ